MSLAESFNGIGNVIATGLGLYQSEVLHHKTQTIEQSRHEHELEILRQQHRKELITAKQTYLITTFTDIEQYCQELNENLINSAKDAERDMVDQRNQQFQTILLAGTIMLTALFNVLVQAILPLESGQVIVILFSVSNAASVAFISLNMLLCVQLTNRVSQFMYRRSEANLRHLKDAMNETKEMMCSIRGENPDRGGLPEFGRPNDSFDENDSDEEEKDADVNTDIENNKNKYSNLETAKRKAKNSGHITQLSSKEVDNQMSSHESIIHNYLYRRSAINERREMIRFGVVSFENFWNTSCRDTGLLALLFFYLGTAFLLFATMVFFWAQFYYGYNSHSGAMVAVVTVGVSLFLSLGFAVYLRFFDPTINALQEGSNSTRSSTKERRDSLFDDSSANYGRAELNSDKVD